jgi:hypothetical protein
MRACGTDPSSRISAATRPAQLPRGQSILIDWRFSCILFDSKKKKSSILFKKDAEKREREREREREIRTAADEFGVSRVASTTDVAARVLQILHFDNDLLLLQIVHVPQPYCDGTSVISKEV